MKETKSYLKFSALSKIVFWDFYSLSNKNVINSNYPIVPLKEVITQRKGFITIEDSLVYKRCKAQVQAKGIVLRDEVFGKEIKTKKQQVCKTNDFLVAEIDAKVGGFGIVPDYLSNAIVSGHYFLFEIDNSKLLSEYLDLVVKQNDFFKQIKSTGSTNYAAIRPYHVLDYLIPLPSISEQEGFVNAYHEKIAQAIQLEKEVERLDTEIEEYLFEKLELKKIENELTKKGLQFHSFKTIDRWDIWVNKRTGVNGKFSVNKLKDIVLGKPFYGANVKGIDKVTDTRYIRITDINENGTLNDEIKSPEFVDEKYLLKENDFLIARSGNTVGKTFLYKSNYGRAIFAGYLVKYNLDLSKVVPEYLIEFTKSYTFKKWIESNQRVAGQPNINGQEFLQAPIIIPPLNIQKEIVSTIDLKRAQILQKKIKAAVYRVEAQKNFENEIF